jgi:hypothetical protein
MKLTNFDLMNKKELRAQTNKVLFLTWKLVAY